jgi:hypothetical protein
MGKYHRFGRIVPRHRKSRLVRRLSLSSAISTRDRFRNNASRASRRIACYRSWGTDHAASATFSTNRRLQRCLCGHQLAKFLLFKRIVIIEQYLSYIASFVDQSGSTYQIVAVRIVICGNL